MERPTYGLCTAIASTSVHEGARTITTQYILQKYDKLRSKYVQVGKNQSLKICISMQVTADMMPNVCIIIQKYAKVCNCMQKGCTSI